MQKSKWPDYLFTVAVRILFGGIFGALFSLIVGYKFILRSFAANALLRVVIWFVIWAGVGAAVAVWNIPDWQRPWYKRTRITVIEDEDSPNGPDE